MTANGLLQIALYFIVLIAAAIPWEITCQGLFREPVFLSRLAGPLERLIYRCCQIDAQQEMSWKTYAGGLLIFNLRASFLSFYCSGFRDFCRSIPRDSKPFLPISPSIPL